MSQKLLQIHRQANVKHNKDKCLVRCISIPFFGKIISQKGVSPDLGKIKVLRHDTIEDEGGAVVPGYTELPREIFTIDATLSTSVGLCTKINSKGENPNNVGYVEVLTA